MTPLLSLQKTAQQSAGAWQKGWRDFLDYSAGAHEQLRVRTNTTIVKKDRKVNAKRTAHSVRSFFTIVGLRPIGTAVTSQQHPNHEHLATAMRRNRRDGDPTCKTSRYAKGAVLKDGPFCVSVGLTVFWCRT